MSCMNLFKPSARENDCSQTIARSLHQIGISVRKLKKFSKLCAFCVEQSMLTLGIYSKSRSWLCSDHEPAVEFKAGFSLATESKSES